MARRPKIAPAKELDVSGIVAPADVMRFMASVADPDENGCWPWIGRLDKNGWGQFWWRGMWIGAHRFACALFNGVVPARKCVHHTEQCARRDCVNPAHLEAVSKRENDRDGGRRAAAKREEACPI